MLLAAAEPVADAPGICWPRDSADDNGPLDDATWSLMCTVQPGDLWPARPSYTVPPLTPSDAVVAAAAVAAAVVVVDALAEAVEADAEAAGVEASSTASR